MDQACCGRAYHALGQVSLQLYCSVQLKCPVAGPPTLMEAHYNYPSSSNQPRLLINMPRLPESN
jgi:hypothetical protein